MIKYYNDYNVVLKEPTPVVPYVESEVLSDRGYSCPTSDLVDINYEVKRHIILLAEYATPEQNYSCYLEEGSHVVWDVSFVKNGKLERISGTVKSFSFPKPTIHKHHKYYLNGVTAPEDSMVVNFDCSFENHSVVIPVNIKKIRRIQYSIINHDDSFNNNIIIPRDGYNFFNKLFKVVVNKRTIDATFDTSNTLIGDLLFADFVKLEELDDIMCDSLISAEHMFKNCRSLKAVKLVEPKKLTYVGHMFENAQVIKEIELDTDKPTDLDCICFNCFELAKFSIKSKEITSAKKAFKGCNKLKDVYFEPKSIKTDMTFISAKLSKESIGNIIRALHPAATNVAPLDRNIITFADGTECPAEYIDDAVYATKHGWILNGLNIPGHKQEEDKSLDEMLEDLTDDPNDNENFIDLYRSIVGEE